MGRVIGIDYGERRCGVAASDPTHTIAGAHEVLVCKNRRQLLADIVRMCETLEAERVVVGLPLNMDGSQGPSAQAAAAFAGELAVRLDLPIETWDERLTTKTAQAALIEAGTRRARRRELVDKVAAQVMLQHYLDAHATDTSA